MRTLITTALAITLAAPAMAQQPQPLRPVDRIYRLEQQVAAGQAVAATQSNRITSLENQLAEALRTNAELGTRLAAAEAQLNEVRAEQDRRNRVQEAGTPAPARPAIAPGAPASAGASLPAATGNFEADGEAAYDVGYQLWQQKKYDQAITALRAMTSAFPNHRRVSWANNLAGRALLDSGQPRAAAEALLANYRGNPKGERAPDSLFYLGQALFALKQSAQACKAYAELEEVYGDNMRGELKSLLPGAKSRAGCR
jgi:TolA-binding protein